MSSNRIDSVVPLPERPGHDAPQIDSADERTHGISSSSLGWLFVLTVGAVVSLSMLLTSGPAKAETDVLSPQGSHSPTKSNEDLYRNVVGLEGDRRGITPVVADSYTYEAPAQPDDSEVGYGDTYRNAADDSTSNPWYSETQPSESDGEAHKVIQPAPEKGVIVNLPARPPIIPPKTWNFSAFQLVLREATGNLYYYDPTDIQRRADKAQFWLQVVDNSQSRAGSTFNATELDCKTGDLTLLLTVDEHGDTKTAGAWTRSADLSRELLSRVCRPEVLQ